MRIVGGKLKGKNIFFIKSLTTRPLKDSVKESIFNIINHSNLLNTKVENSNILDLYSGIGSFGIECISRGANRITFVEKNKEVVKILEKNLINLKIENKSNIIINEIQNFLNLKLIKKFEIIFLDPPFKNSSYLQELNLIKIKKIFTKEHTIIMHREKNSDEDWRKLVYPLVIKIYGRSKIIFGKFLT